MGDNHYETRILHSAIFLSAGLLFAWPAASQNTSRFNFHVGGGFTEPVRHTDGRLNTGFNVLNYVRVYICSSA